MRKNKPDCIGALMAVGISFDDAVSLRRISMTLHRWHELECGDGNNYGSWAIERDDNGDGPAFMVHHHYQHGRGKDYTTRTKIADRERGALKRLGKIMTKYPEHWAYVQTDPRGCALYVGKMNDLPAEAVGPSHPMGTPLDLSSNYNRGIAVYK